MIRLDAAVIGSGCAGLNAADWLHTLGRRKIAIVTEGVAMGTSRNTGSDKQTYYKLSLASGEEDSVRSLAGTLFAGGGVHGDTALAEAAGSVRSFVKLANLGVPFPTNAYGEYIGYKTDHDPRRRATSAGPLTSRFMTECLERSVRGRGVPVLDGMTAAELIVRDGAVLGVLCVSQQGAEGMAGADGKRIGSAGSDPGGLLRDFSHGKSPYGSETCGLCVICARNVILATGGPAACYAAAVYPESQTGMTGMAIRAGARMANLQEWQYGLASTKFRWNVSGTYQQVLPRYISVDEQGTEREFLAEAFDDPAEAYSRVFLKGYQWPFDAAKARGSSLIDILVHHETQALGRRVYLDFSQNPRQLALDRVSKEATEYLSRSGALFGTPIQRLERMNPDAVALYLRNGIDLHAEPLEVAVCAQHHNGGVAVDADWQTSVRGLFAAGEAAGTFGSARPGGSALNSTQVGSLRAAEYIAWDTAEDVTAPEGFEALAAAAAERMLDLCARTADDTESPARVLADTRRRMSKVAAHIRDVPGMRALFDDLAGVLRRTDVQAPGLETNGRDAVVRRSHKKGNSIDGYANLTGAVKARDALIAQRAILSAMLLSAETQGSHGSAMVLDAEGESPAASLPRYRFRPRVEPPYNAVIETADDGAGPVSALHPVRGMPEPDDWFETNWAEYRARRERQGDGDPCRNCGG